jgi:hypothetical protein
MKIQIREKNILDSSVVEPVPQGAETFGRSRNIEVSALAPALGQLKYFEKI